MNKIILNLKNTEDIIFAARAGLFLLERPEKEDALLEYGEGRLYYVKRNKKSVTVWPQQ